MYANGQNVPQDDTEAVRWFHMAADQGEGDSQSDLGILYMTGRGVAQDDVEALMWCERGGRRRRGLSSRAQRVSSRRRDSYRNEIHLRIEIVLSRLINAQVSISLRGGVWYSAIDLALFQVVAISTVDTENERLPGGALGHDVNPRIA